MQSKRRSTVHDLASLRLHPDGTRVQADETVRELNADLEERAGERRRSARQRGRESNVVRDRQGNLIAKDAAGSVGVKKFRKKRRGGGSAVSGVGDASRDQEVFDLDAIRDVDDDEGQSALGSKTTGKRRRKDVKDPRALKRRAFEDDLGFITSSPAPEPAFVEGGSSVLSHSDGVSRTKGKTSTRIENGKLLLGNLPSSDLLKHIHYYAASFYTERGELWDAPREGRREKRERERKKRLKNLLENGVSFDDEEGEDGARNADADDGVELDLNDEDEEDRAEEKGGETVHDDDENESDDESKAEAELKAEDERDDDNEIDDMSDDNDSDGEYIDVDNVDSSLDSSGGESDHDRSKEKGKQKASSDMNEEIGKKRRRRKKKGGRSKEHLKRDMYRAFDGSALVALGILMQEYIVSRMNLPISSPDEENEDAEEKNAKSAGDTVRASDAEPEEGIEVENG